jgi:Ca2+-binding RTX toxin-like protein
MLHALEARRLLSAAVADGVLLVRGTAQRDEIVVRLEGGIFTVTENGVATTFDATGVNAVVIRAGDGDDAIRVDESVLGFWDVNAPPPTTGISYTAFDIEIHGEGGDDWIQCGSGDDALFGDIGNDSIWAGEGDDEVYGGNGKDTLDGYSGDDLISGQGGVDCVTYIDTYEDTELSLDGVKNDYAWLEYLSHTGKPLRRVVSTDNILPDIENVIGSRYDDIIKGSAADNYIDSSTGDDTINGGLGDDTLNGNFGDDDVHGGGGAQDVAYYADRFDRLNISLDGERNDGAHATAFHAREHDNVHSDIEIVWGGRKADYIAGNSAANQLVGGRGDDTLQGNGGDDTLIGGLGADTVL